MILIIEDDYNFAVTLKILLLKYYKDHTIEILTNFNQIYLDQYNIDILFVDIKLKEGDGIELAKEYRAKGNDDLDIVFISSQDNYIHHSFLKFPRFFISKVYLKQDLIQCILVLEERQRKKEMQMMINGIAVKLLDILYVEANRNHVYYIFRDGRELKRRLSLSLAEEEICEFDFIRCHLSYLVNAAHIRHIARDYLVLDLDIKIPINGNYYLDILEKFADYRFR